MYSKLLRQLRPIRSSSSHLILKLFLQHALEWLRACVLVCFMLRVLPSRTRNCSLSFSIESSRIFILRVCLLARIRDGQNNEHYIKEICYCMMSKKGCAPTQNHFFCTEKISHNFGCAEEVDVRYCAMCACAVHTLHNHVAHGPSQTCTEGAVASSTFSCSDLRVQHTCCTTYTSHIRHLRIHHSILINSRGI